MSDYVDADLDVADVPYVGAYGIDYVGCVLTNENPQEAIGRIQETCGVGDPSCLPLLGLLDQLGLSRAEAMRSVLQTAMRVLVEKARKSDAHTMEALLAASFKYLGITELRDLPIAMMGALQQVPHQYLKQLSEDKDLFQALPPKVQCQVWEYDKKLLQLHALPLVISYAHEPSAIHTCLAMGEFLIPEANYKAVSTSLSNRKQLRKSSEAIQQLKQMVGNSLKIYRNIVELCVVKYRDSDSMYVGVNEGAHCSLRSQLLMALHDDLATKVIAEQDKCHNLAWALDACLIHRRLGEKHLTTLKNWFAEFENRSAARSNRRPNNSDDDAESQGVSGTAFLDLHRMLGDAGMVLRDPAVMHLLLNEVVQQLHMGIKQQELPRNNQALALVTRLLQLACMCQQMLRERRFYMPEVSTELMNTFYPAVCAVLLMSAAAKEGLDVKLPDQPDADYIHAIMLKNDVARKVAQLVILDRLRVMEMGASRLLLQACSAVLQQQPRAAVLEWGPFAASLAQRYSALLNALRQKKNPTSAASTSASVRGGKEGNKEEQFVNSPVWNYGLEGVLLKCVDTHPQVQEEVLKLLLNAAPVLGPSKVAQHLSTAFANSEGSRAEAVAASQGNAPNNSGEDSDGGADIPEGVRRTGGGENSIKALYQQMVAKVPAVQQLVSPALQTYLQSSG